MQAFGVSEEKVYAYGREAKKFTERVLARPFIVVTRFQDAMGRSKLPRYYSFVFPNGSRPDLGSLLTNAGLTRSYGQKAANDLGLNRYYYDQLEPKGATIGSAFTAGTDLRITAKRHPRSKNPRLNLLLKSSHTKTRKLKNQILPLEQ